MRYLFYCCLPIIVLLSGCKEPTSPDQAKAANEPVEIERVKAEAGVGKQGQIIGDKEGVIRTPVKTYFSAKQRLEFMKVTHALNIYDAEHGYKPKSHEEFMSKIVEFNNIKLPELPEGQKYIWDPEQGELLVERPKQD